MSRTLTSGKVSTAMTIANARQRAIAEGIEIRQVEGGHVWVATSGTDNLKAYGVVVRDGRFVSCSCKAGEMGRYCKHRAAWEMAQEAKEASNG